MATIDPAMETHTITALVNDKPGVLTRVSGLFRRRGFNIDSLAVGTTEESGISRMTIVVESENGIVDQVEKQLNKLIDVIQIFDHTEEDLIEREIALIKLRATLENRGEIMQLAQVFQAEVASISPGEETMIVEITGEENKIEAFLETLSKFEVLELVRTGRIALVRGSTIT